MTDSPLTWHGRPVLTIRLAAQRKGVSTDHMRKTLSRMRRAGALTEITPPPLDRQPLYYQADFDTAWNARPGRGANLRKKAS